ncbi:MAG: hypothetical protein JWO24_2956 [Rhodospirillales bacterium]|nr:hypothetical protein [Rhodospirillales bacterium]
MKPVALLDGDIIAYTAASICQVTEGLHGPLEVPTFNEADVRFAVRRMVDEWCDKAGAGERVVLLTGRMNFRKIVAPSYKMNRVGAAKPVALGYARGLLLEQYGARIVEGLEADDLLGLMLTGSMSDGRGVVVSVDKDLRTVPGLHLNPRKDEKPVEVTLHQADFLWMTQTLTGDPVDGYGGAKGVGPVGASRTLGGVVGVSGLWASARAAFQSVGMTHDDALQQARLARILRTGDYDKETKEVLLWHPTTPVRLALPTATPSSPTG